MSDNVDHPSHYTSHPSGVECIQITEYMNFNIGNAMKYLWRAGLKSDDPREDLMKARWYADRELRRLDGMPVPAPVEAPVARVFNVGDPEPADRETIVLRGNRRDMDVRISYGKGGSGVNLTAWWCVGDDPRYSSHGSWSYWLENYGPLIEVTEDAPKVARLPRVFDSFEDIPSDVDLVSDCDGDTWGRNGVRSSMCGWLTAAWDDSAPFTEVLTP